MNKLLKFGILGCGMIANVHAQAIGNLDEAVLVGVTDSCTANAKGLAEKYGVSVYADYNAMLEDDEIDVVCICIPSGFHADAAIQALKRKKHVVLEKPMALTVEDADEIKKAVSESGCLLTVISQLRFFGRCKESERAGGKRRFRKVGVL